ncbi:hypothetical protein [Thermus altitudinis]|uniref:hypothetical protein n=1 Tax=Thermus altitudinis TaxID=2908145 RepID=UPI001FAA62BD|nr:hypothetical protein [Thermus altitudinis]
MRTLSLVLAVLSLLLLLPALLPLVGWLNWLVLPLALLAAGLGVLAGEERASREKGGVGGYSPPVCKPGIHGPPTSAGG